VTTNKQGNTGSGGGEKRSWNLGKEYVSPAAKKAAEAEAKRKQSEAESRAEKEARKREGAATNVRPPKVRLADEVETEGDKPKRRSPYDQDTEEPRNELREWINHPITLIAAALLLIVAATLLTFGLSGRRAPGPVAVVVQDTPESYVLAWLGMGENPVVRSASEESQDAREARLLLAAGQIATASAAFREQQQQRDGLSVRAFRYLPPALESAPTVPEGQPGHIQNLVYRDEAAEQSADIARAVAENSSNRGVRPSQLRDLGARLIEEGEIAMRFARGEDDAPPYPERATMPSDEASRLIGVLFPSRFASQVEAVRLRAFPPIGGPSN